MPYLRRVQRVRRESSAAPAHHYLRLRTRYRRQRYDDVIPSDAQVNLGNSGGPRFDMDGDVIGTAIVSPSGGSVGIGFSIAAEGGIVHLKENGAVTRGSIDARAEAVTEGARGQLRPYRAAGPTGRRPRRAGVQAGDVITTRQWHGDIRDFGGTITGMPPGAPAIHGGEQKTFNMTGRRPAGSA